MRKFSKPRNWKKNFMLVSFVAHSLFIYLFTSILIFTFYVFFFFLVTSLFTAKLVLTYRKFHSKIFTLNLELHNALLKKLWPTSKGQYTYMFLIFSFFFCAYNFLCSLKTRRVFFLSFFLLYFMNDKS